MTNNKTTLGHLAALITVITWGTTFISTKVLLDTFSPIEILFARFLIALIALFVIHPKTLKVSEKKQEIYFAAAGLLGVTLYFLFENIALTYTLASNIGVIVSISPFFTALLAHIFLQGERLKGHFFVGFVTAIIGIFLISFNGNVILKLNPIGDTLGVLAAVVWAGYSIVTKKISNFGYPIVQTTRRIFFYGIIFMLPALLYFGINMNKDQIMQVPNILNLLYLGLGASALCFGTWSYALTQLGAVKTSVYIYTVPVITIITSIIVLKEPITPMAVIGTILTLSGLFLSDRKKQERL